MFFWTERVLLYLYIFADASARAIILFLLGTVGIVDTEQAGVHTLSTRWPAYLVAGLVEFGLSSGVPPLTSTVLELEAKLS